MLKRSETGCQHNHGLEMVDKVLVVQILEWDFLGLNADSTTDLHPYAYMR